jgi:hypothetical protein
VYLGLECRISAQPSLDGKKSRTVTKTQLAIAINENHQIFPLPATPQRPS